jgi:dipeptidase D
MLSPIKPISVWKYFAEIANIPHPSKKEEKLITYLKEFGKTHGLETSIDAVGNVLIKKSATKGFENKKTIALQSHIDMVCEKNSDVKHDFETDPIDIYEDGDWVKAKGTTLGADDGIGVAAQLALLAATDVEHGNIECLFTVDEETGLTGAFALKEGFLSANVLINLDSENDSELFIGCAGGIDTLAVFDYKKEKSPEKYFYFNVSVSGLKGGHSGDDIDKGLGNANKILTRYLWQLNKKTDLRLCYIDGGNLRNAIAREALALVAVPWAEKENARIEFNHFVNDIELELLSIEPNLKFSLESETPQNFCIDKNTSNRLLDALYACPHGVIAMSNDIKGLVETSTNLASVKCLDDNKIQVNTSQRSSTESLKYDIMYMVESVFTLAGASVTHGDGYPGWKPNPHSKIVDTTAQCYRRLFNEEPHIRAIHAGLECGLFLKKYPQLDMVSFGPTILGAHSPNERVQISSVDKFWTLLCEVLRSI